MPEFYDRNHLNKTDLNEENDEPVIRRPSIRTRESFYRRIRGAGGGNQQSLCITIPRKFLKMWNVESGDYLLITSYGDKMVIEKPQPIG